MLVRAGQDASDPLDLCGSVGFPGRLVLPCVSLLTCLWLTLLWGLVGRDFGLTNTGSGLGLVVAL